MVKIAYSLYDSSAKLYTAPFFCASEQQALRGLEAALFTQEKTNLAQYPQDFTLYEMGSFDESSGTLGQTYDRPQKIINCQDHKLAVIREQYERDLDEKKLRDLQAELNHTQPKTAEQLFQEKQKDIFNMS